MIAREPTLSTSAVDEIQRVQVEAELERILQSPGFRTSRRSQEFLRYIVTTALDGRFEGLKERVIGYQVFQRLPDYDTGEYSIVRVKANELRKRLAQFYRDTTERSAVEIHLPKGSYTPEYRWTTVEYPDTPPVRIERPKPIIRTHLLAPVSLIAGGILVITLCLVSWYFIQQRVATGVVDQFWKPILQDESQPILCTGSPALWKLNDRSSALASHDALPATLPSSELIRDPNHYIGWGDALAMTELSMFLAHHHKDPEVRLANDISFFELSRSPVILIGGQSNPWTMQLANNIRFVFESADSERFISDKMNAGKKWAFEPGATKVDHVVVSRIFDSKTGKMIVLAAGLSHYGTSSAGQILTNPVYLQRALQNAPKDWSRRNMQLLFRVEIFGTTAGQPVLEASHFW